MIERAPGGRKRGRRGGFTLIEMAVVCLMLCLLATMMAGGWSAFGRPASDVEARCRIAQEASLAAESLVRDLSGYKPGADGRAGGLGSSKFLDRMQPENAALWLCFDSESNPNGTPDWGSPDAVVVYQLMDDRLVRSDHLAGTTVTVARYLSGLQVLDQPGLTPGVMVQLSFSYRNFQRTYTLYGIDP